MIAMCVADDYMFDRWGLRPSFFKPPMISSSELYAYNVSMRIIPALVVNAQDEWIFEPTK